jgi:hypothetical protein
MSLLDDFIARRKMRRELEVFADHLADRIRDSAADISPKHLHTGYEFGPVQQWLDVDIIAAARRGDRDAVLRIAEQSRQWIDKCRSDYAVFLAERKLTLLLRWLATRGRGRDGSLIFGGTSKSDRFAPSCRNLMPAASAPSAKSSGKGKGARGGPSLRAPLGVSGSPRSSSLATAARCYGVQHHRYPFGSSLHDRPVREFTTTAAPAYGAGA